MYRRRMLVFPLLFLCVLLIPAKRVEAAVNDPVESELSRGDDGVICARSYVWRNPDACPAYGPGTTAQPQVAPTPLLVGSQRIGPEAFLAQGGGGALYRGLVLVQNLALETAATRPWLGKGRCRQQGKHPDQGELLRSSQRVGSPKRLTGAAGEESSRKKTPGAKPPAG